MRFNFKKVVMTFAGILFCLSSAEATLTFSLSPASQTVRLNDPVSLELWLDATDPTLGGGLDIAYDHAILTFNSFTFEESFPTDPDFTYVPENWTGGEEVLTFGNLSGIKGNFRVGIIGFSAIGIGTTEVKNSNNEYWGGFSGAVFNKANITVVPEPSVFLLVASGLGIIGALRRFKKQ